MYLARKPCLTYSPLHLCFRHPLAKAVLLLCKAVQLSLSPLKGEGAMSCLSHCDRASSYMSSSVAIPLTQSGNLLNKVLKKEKKSKYRLISALASLILSGILHTRIYMVHSEFDHAHVYRYI